MLMSFCCLFFS